MTLDSTQRLGPFPLGMDNRVPDYQLKLPDDASTALAVQPGRQKVGTTKRSQ